jgi:hypothetical protein
MSGDLLRTYTGAEFGDRFGWALASNDDLLFVGAPESRVGTIYYGDGKVVVLNELGDRFTINNPEPGAGLSEEEFGKAVGIIGNDLYVGALHDNDGGKVWQFDGETGSIVGVYNSPHGTLGNGGRPQFGNSLDVNRDYLLVGANQSSASGVNASGTAYLFDRSSRDLIHTFFDPMPDVLDNFGVEVKLFGRYALVGAHADGDVSSGSVFVFDIESGSLVQTIHSPSATPHFFGLEMVRVGHRNLAVWESTGDGIVQLYVLVPEPSSSVLCVLGALVVYSQVSPRRGSL